MLSPGSGGGWVALLTSRNGDRQSAAHSECAQVPFHAELTCTGRGRRRLARAAVPRPSSKSARAPRVQLGDASAHSGDALRRRSPRRPGAHPPRPCPCAPSRVQHAGVDDLRRQVDGEGFTAEYNPTCSRGRHKYLGCRCRRSSPACSSAWPSGGPRRARSAAGRRVESSATGWVAGSGKAGANPRASWRKTSGMPRGPARGHGLGSSVR